jgi:mRNA-degrading endonuclease toxin of MazEF toxin-antitoxin module
LAFRFQGKGALVVLDQLRAIDKSTLIRRAGALSPATLKAALTALQHTFAP